MNKIVYYYLFAILKCFKFISTKHFAVSTTLLLLFLSLFLTENAFAMHIAEGILPFKWAILWYLVLIPFLFYGIKQIKSKSTENLSFKPLVGLLSAVVFIISCMPVPVPIVGTCSHPTGVAISAIMLGPFISTVITTVALLLQALFLAHGGISTLGANVVAMGIIGSFGAVVAFRLFSMFSKGIIIPAFIAGIIADWATYIMTTVELASALSGNETFMSVFGQVFIAFIPTQLPLGIIEGAITAGVVKLLYLKRPDLLISMNVIKAKEAVI